MSASNITESDTLDWVLGGVDPAWRAGATGYFALVTGVSVDEADPIPTSAPTPPMYASQGQRLHPGAAPAPPAPTPTCCNG